MRVLRAWAIRLAGLFRAMGRGEQFDAELESHLELHVEENLRRGMTREEARRQALIALGGPQYVRDEYRDRGGVPVFESLAQDVRFALRMLRKSPGFAVTAVVVLALGIGANGAVFNMINALLLKPVSGGGIEADPVGLYSGERERPDFRLFSYPEFADLRSRNDVFTELFAESMAMPGVTENGLTRRALAGYVSFNYFQALGAAPAIGRFFTADEERPGSGAAVAVVSHDYWRRLGLPADVIGRTLTLNTREVAIVGVAPQGFRGTLPGGATEIWLPFGISRLLTTDLQTFANIVADDRSSFTLLLAGTLKPGISIEEAQARLEPLAAGLEAAFPVTNRDQRLVVAERSRWDFGDRPYSDSGPRIVAAVLMAIAGMVLVVACLNLTGMQLARGSARRQEIAVRLALGGSRFRVVRQLLVEGLMLSAFAGVVGLGVSWWAAHQIVSFLGSMLQASLGVNIAPDGRVLAWIAGACIFSALVFSLGPALKLSRLELVTAMKQTGALPPTRRRLVSLHALMVGAQVALSLALLVTAGVFARASLNLAEGDPGFPLEGKVLVEIDSGIAGMDEPSTRDVYARVLDRLRSLPDVTAASMASIVPFGRIRDGRMVRVGSQSAAATYTVVGSGYFDALGLRVLAGREFTPVEEGRATEPVAIVDEALARQVFGGRNPIGEFLQLMQGDDLDGGPLRVVGVVAPVRDDMLRPASAHVYVPSGSHFNSMMTFHVRTEPGLEAVTVARAREAIRDVDPQLPVLAVTTMAARRLESPNLGAVKLVAVLFASFGVISLVLSAAGLYGLRAYLVAQRTRELGVRLALGATRGGVLGQLLKEGTVTAAFGIAAGLVLAVGLVQLLRRSGMLYEIGLVDPVVFAVAPLVLVVATLAASYVPARRALRIDPATALRPE